MHVKSGIWRFEQFARKCSGARACITGELTVMYTVIDFHWVLASGANEHSIAARWLPGRAGRAMSELTRSAGLLTHCMTGRSERVRKKNGRPFRKVRGCRYRVGRCISIGTCEGCLRDFSGNADILRIPGRPHLGKFDVEGSGHRTRDDWGHFAIRLPLHQCDGCSPDRVSLFPLLNRHACARLDARELVIPVPCRSLRRGVGIHCRRTVSSCSPAKVVGAPW